MARRRFFVDHFHNQQAELRGEEAHHLTQVLRVEAGQKYEVSDNNLVFLAEVEMARKDRVVFRTLEQIPANVPPVHISLLLALIKFDHFELVLEKATELGVGEITPLIANRSERGIEHAVEKRSLRWKRILLEASQQSRRTHLPVLHGAVRVRQAVETPATHRLFLDEDRTGLPILRHIAEPGVEDSVALMVGPEGGWVDAERELATAAGWKPVSLGPLILRAETAAIASLAVIDALYMR